MEKKENETKKALVVLATMTLIFGLFVGFGATFQEGSEKVATLGLAWWLLLAAFVLMTIRWMVTEWTMKQERQTNADLLYTLACNLLQWRSVGYHFEMVAGRPGDSKNRDNLWFVIATVSAIMVALGQTVQARLIRMLIGVAFQTAYRKAVDAGEEEKAEFAELWTTVSGLLGRRISAEEAKEPSGDKPEAVEEYLRVVLDCHLTKYLVEGKVALTVEDV